MNHHQQYILVSTSEILYVKAERPYIALVTATQTYLHNETLSGFLKMNPVGDFIQIHKSAVINSQFIRSYSSRKNGDYDIEMTNGDIVRASRNYNQNFKIFTRSQDSL